MKKIFSLAIIALLTVSASFAASYKLDNGSVDNMFDNATEITASRLEVLNSNVANYNAIEASDDLTLTLLIAIVIDYPVGLGAFGVHRYILGTKGSMWAIYTFTVCGIFGIVPTIDWFVLIVDGLILGNGDKYIDNEDFFMWM